MIILQQLTSMYEYNPEFFYWTKILEWILIRYVSSYVYRNYSAKETLNGKEKEN